MSDRLLSDATLSLGTKLLGHLVGERPAKNVFISPTSISLALALALNAAAGTTAEQIAAVLGLPSPDLEVLNATATKLIKELSMLDMDTAEMAMDKWLGLEDYQVIMRVANGLWTNQNIPIKADFVERVKAVYQAEAAAVDLSTPEVIDQINEWAKERTAGRIEKVLNPFFNNPLAVLVNAVYFKGVWQTQFKFHYTEEGLFHLADGMTKPLPLMRGTTNRPYYEDAQLQMVALQFSGHGVSAIIALPKPGHRLDDLIGGLSADWWQQKAAALFREQDSEVDLTIPRFQIEFGDDLIPALTAMGIGEAFVHGQADFSRLSDLEATIEQVSHKTFLLVNEEGCEAVGATTIMMAWLSMPHEPIEMRVDRPFLFAIITHPDPTLLFVGAINDPQAVKRPTW